MVFLKLCMHIWYFWLVLQYLVEGNVSRNFLIDFIIGMAEIVHSEARLGLRVRKYYKAVFLKQLFKHNLWSFLLVTIPRILSLD